MGLSEGAVVAVSCNDVYSFTKPVRDEIVLVEGLGVEGDVHAGPRVRHRSRVRVDPTQPNLRQVHLIQAELFGEVGEKGYGVEPGNLGENVTTGGIDLLGLPLGTILRFGPSQAAPNGGASGGGASGGGEDTAAVAGAGTAPGSGGGPAVGAVDGVEAAAGSGGTAATTGGGAADGTGAGATAGTDGKATAGTGGGAAGGGRAGSVADVLTAADAATLTEPAAAAAEAVREAVAREAAAREAAAREAAARGAAAGEGDDGTDLRAAVVVTGLRSPCVQINKFQPGLLREVLALDEEGQPVRKAGVMAVVLRGGPIRPGDVVAVELPPGPVVPLRRV